MRKRTSFISAGLAVFLGFALFFAISACGTSGEDADNGADGGGAAPAVSEETITAARSGDVEEGVKAASEFNVKTMELDEGQVRIERLSDDLLLHTYRAYGLPNGSAAVNTHIFESSDSLLIFDAQFYKSAAEDVDSYIKSLEKPIDKIVVSHSHADHYWGYVYMSDLGPLWGTEAVKEEAELEAQAFANGIRPLKAFLNASFGDRYDFPVDDLPEITETFSEGSFEFGGTTFRAFDLPTQEAETQTFIHIPEHQILMVFDAIMPDGHQFVGFGSDREESLRRIEIGKETYATLMELSDVEYLLFGHGLHPGNPEKYFGEAIASLDIYLNIIDRAESGTEFIGLAAEAMPGWHTVYLNLVAANLFPAPGFTN